MQYENYNTSIRIVFAHPGYGTREFTYKISNTRSMRAVYYEIVKFITLLWNFDGEFKRLLISAGRYVQAIGSNGGYKKNLKYTLEDFLTENNISNLGAVTQFLFTATIRENK